MGYCNVVKFDLGIDSTSNIYFGANSYTSVTFGFDTIFSDKPFAFFAKFDTSGTNLWLANMDGTKEVNDFQTARSGNSYITGKASGTQHIGTDSISNPGNSSYVAKCSFSGIPQWQKLVTGIANDGCSLGVGHNESTTMLGLFEDSIHFSTLPAMISQGGDFNIFLTSYDVTGDEIRVSSAHPNFSFSTDNHKLRIDPMNNIYFSGYGMSTMYINVDSIPIGYREPYVIKLDSLHNLQCNVRLLNCTRPEISFDKSGSLYLVGTTGEYLPYFAINSDTFHCPTKSIYIAKLDQNCALHWVDTISIPLTPYPGVVTTVGDNFLKVFPNPATSVIDLQFESPRYMGYWIRLVDIYGRILFNEEIINRSLEIDVSKFAKGIYMLEISNNVDKISKKIIIN